MTFNIALRVVIGSGIIFIKFDRAWMFSVFNAFAVTLTLTSWPWKFVVYQASRDQSLYEI